MNAYHIFVVLIRYIYVCISITALRLYVNRCAGNRSTAVGVINVASNTRAHMLVWERLGHYIHVFFFISSCSLFLVTNK